MGLNIYKKKLLTFSIGILKVPSLIPTGITNNFQFNWLTQFSKIMKKPALEKKYKFYKFIILKLQNIFPTKPYFWSVTKTFSSVGI